MYNLQTSTKPDRVFGSGTWEIRFDGKGGPISYGDKIHLLNHFGTMSYLDTCGSSTCLSSNGLFSLQTSKSPLGSGTWEIISVDGVGGYVKDGGRIHLQHLTNGTPSYLDTCEPSTCEGSQGFKLQTSTNPSRHKGSGTWEIKIIYQGK